ncbi:hypothetical protein [Polluticoccus soli]|uniref:hypothetical protein n=1 Tax=Polluticoccus soli TaxID=3034150 RepID=UPI0023E09EEB|nr:hypothetical protein [Flavipsychrobacter sp. JY13-12]
MSAKRYEILQSLPTYGPLYVPITADGDPFYSEGFVVRFYKSDGTDWVANFQPGWTDLKAVIELKDTPNLLIVACGSCYFMNPNDRTPIDVFGAGYSNILKASNDRVILHDPTNLTIVESDGTHWYTERISWDGLEDLRVEGNKVVGLSFDPTNDADEWVEFSYDLDAKILEGGSYHRYDNKKPWWKIW